MRTRDVRYLYYSQREVRAVGGRPFAQESAASGVPSGRLTAAAAALSRACANAHGLEVRTHSTIRTLGRHDAGSPVARLSFRAALSRHNDCYCEEAGGYHATRELAKLGRVQRAGASRGRVPRFLRHDGPWFYQRERAGMPVVRWRRTPCVIRLGRRRPRVPIGRRRG